MFKFILLLFLSFSVFWVIFKILGFFSGAGQGNKKRDYNQSQRQNNTYQSPKQEKKFSKNEGRYVNYEEVKDED